MYKILYKLLTIIYKIGTFLKKLCNFLENQILSCRDVLFSPAYENIVKIWKCKSIRAIWYYFTLCKVNSFLSQTILNSGNSLGKDAVNRSDIWDKVLKSGLINFCESNFSSAGHIPWIFLNAVFLKIYLVHSWILCPIWTFVYQVSLC